MDFSKAYYLYLKSNDSIKKMQSFLSSHGYSLTDAVICQDSNRDNLNYKKLKEQILVNPFPLFFQHLSSIGKTKADILSELKWFRKHEIQIIVLELPSTWNFGNEELNLKSLDVLLDIFSILQNYNNFEIANTEYADGGRHKIKYPENWEELFSQYSKKEISANEFQERTGLKRATFFNLLSEYKTELRENKVFLKNNFQHITIS